MRVLIIAYDFPPYVSVGGLRPNSWYQYFKEFGAHPIIVTRQWSNTHGNELDYVAEGDSRKTIVEETERGTIVRTPYKPTLSNQLLLRFGKTKFALLRKCFTAWHELGQFFMPVGPKQTIYEGAREYLAQHDIDVIVATGGPFVLFKYASKLSTEFNIPWVADYRDPWTQNGQAAGRKIPRWFDAYFERHSLRNVSAITTVSEYFKHRISELIPEKPYSIVPNGYDPENVDRVADVAQGSEQFTIALAGSVSDWHPIEVFFECCNRFVSSHKNPRFQVQFIGINRREEFEQTLVRRFPSLVPHVIFCPALPNTEVMVQLARANVLLAFNMYAHSGTKIYDYLALKRLVLLCFSDDPEARRLKDDYYTFESDGETDERVLEKLVEDFTCGIVVRDAEHLVDVLRSLYEQFLLNGCIECQSQSSSKYSRRVLASEMVKVLGEVVASQNETN